MVIPSTATRAPPAGTPNSSAEWVPVRVKRTATRSPSTNRSCAAIVASGSAQGAEEVRDALAVGREVRWEAVESGVGVVQRGDVAVDVTRVEQLDGGGDGGGVVALAPTVSGGCSSNVPRQVGAPGAVQGAGPRGRTGALRSGSGWPRRAGRRGRRPSGPSPRRARRPSRAAASRRSPGLGVTGIAFGAVEVACAGSRSSSVRSRPISWWMSAERAAYAPRSTWCA